MKTAQISKAIGSGWLLEITENGALIGASNHPSEAYAKDAAKRAGCVGFDTWQAGNVFWK